MYFASMSSVTLPELRQKYTLGPAGVVPRTASSGVGTRPQMVRYSAFESLHQTADCQLLLRRDQQMQMILRHVSLHDREFMLPPDVPDQIPQALRAVA